MSENRSGLDWNWTHHLHVCARTVRDVCLQPQHELGFAALWLGLWLLVLYYLWLLWLVDFACSFCSVRCRFRWGRCYVWRLKTSSLFAVASELALICTKLVRIRRRPCANSLVIQASCSLAQRASFAVAFFYGTSEHLIFIVCATTVHGSPSLRAF